MVGGQHSDTLPTILSSSRTPAVVSAAPNHTSETLRPRQVLPKPDMEGKKRQK
jgi:hypothetical protein